MCCLPEWPAASAALLRLIAALGGPKGREHPDNAVRQMSIDFVGLVAAQLYLEALLAEEAAQRVQALTKGGAPSSIALTLFQTDSLFWQVTTDAM